MQISNNRNSTIAFILTLIFPFCGLIYTLNHWRECWAKNSFWLASIFCGAVLVYCPEGTILGNGSDSGRYVLKLMEMYSDSSVTIGRILSSYLKDTQVMDLYQPLTTFLVSRFTDNGHVLFAVFAFVFGFFYSRNIWYILEKLPNNRLGNLVILLALYLLICPITQINGVRMWTALHVYVYGLMPYLLENDRSKIWWVALTPLIHFSFLYVAILGILWFVLSMRNKSSKFVIVIISYIVFLSSLFFGSLNTNVMGEVIGEFSPDSFEERLSGYLNEDYMADIAERKSEYNWYVAMSGSVMYWSYNILLLFLLMCLKRNKQLNTLMPLYVYSLIISGFANIMYLFPSGGRFQLLSQMFIVPLIIMVCMILPSSDRYRRIVNVALVFLLLPLIFQIRQLFDFFSISFLLGNFFTMFIWENNVPLIDIIKNLF